MSNKFLIRVSIHLVMIFLLAVALVAQDRVVAVVVGQVAVEVDLHKVGFALQI